MIHTYRSSELKKVMTQPGMRIIFGIFKVAFHINDDIFDDRYLDIMPFLQGKINYLPEKWTIMSQDTLESLINLRNKFILHKKINLGFCIDNSNNTLTICFDFPEEIVKSKL